MINPVHARTHAEFLNKAFGTDYKGWMKTVWHYPQSPNISVWMVRFYGQNDGWENRILDGGEVISEKYVGPTVALPSLARYVDGERRVVVSIEDRLGARSYTVLGVYDLSPSESTLLHRIYRRLPDEEARALVPEIYTREQ